MRKKYIWLILMVAVIAVILIGGKMYMDKVDKSLMEDKKVENRIAKEFASTFLTPEKKDVSEVTFYKAPANQNDATGNRNYFFYVNGNKAWKVGASVKSKTDEVWAFGSNDIDLVEKKDAKDVTHLKINHWESK
ncbi:hypothetical protein HCB27_14340 [Listeria booriae]|uniref:Uncharacterized protein n=1 Tax=Listeria booriae TaxID=1552123 RepID=A0A7X0Z8A3_9LIST|nr:hypothetical protein [Listeria booriae]MBC2177772.1 hypothetical protein [Listeria booriae]MBC2177807.1 hypothetical protein [Listeria booriae]